MGQLLRDPGDQGDRAGRPGRQPGSVRLRDLRGLAGRATAPRWRKALRNDRRRGYLVVLAGYRTVRRPCPPVQGRTVREPAAGPFDPPRRTPCRTIHSGGFAARLPVCRGRVIPAARRLLDLLSPRGPGWRPARRRRCAGRQPAIEQAEQSHVLDDSLPFSRPSPPILTLASRRPSRPPRGV